MTNEQENLMRQHFADTRTDRLAAELGVSYRTVCRWAASLGLRKNKDFRQAFSAINGRKMHSWSYHGTKFSAEVTAFLRRHYATTDNRVLAAHFHVNDRTIRRWAVRLGLRKDKEYAKMHRQACRGITPEERFCLVATIRELYPDGLHDDELMRRTGRSMPAIRTIASQYSIHRSEEWNLRRGQKLVDTLRRLSAEGKLKRERTRQMEVVVQRDYATADNDELARRLGVSVQYVKIMARRLGLKKTREYRSEQLRRQWEKR